MTEAAKASRYWRSQRDLPPEVLSPLAPFNGEKPAAPAWFENALRQAPVETRIDVGGADIEVLQWGAESALPSLLLLHGSGASADWWRFIAPYLAHDRRVVAMTWSGMGKSGWRGTYSFESYADEAEAVAWAARLFDAEEAPVLIGHSMGGMVGTLCCSRPDNRFRAMIAVDSGILDYRPPADWRELENEARIAANDWPSSNLSPSLQAALLRYRFLPPQSSPNSFIIDFIARSSLKEVTTPDGRQGWTWRADPKLRFLGQEPDFFADRLPHVNRPMVMIRGGVSALIPPDRFRPMIEKAPPGTLGFDIPEAGHHVLVDQPLALVSAIASLLVAWPPTRVADSKRS